MDRNAGVPAHCQAVSRSLSARRAWIEMMVPSSTVIVIFVALRKESVDRNSRVPRYDYLYQWSLSARRAWIEINSSLDAILAGVVALRKESVDRNDVIRPAIDVFLAVALRKESVDRNLRSHKEPESNKGRSPQGERG